MELTKRQKEHLLAGISEGLKTRELNKRAASFQPPYKVSRQQVDYYRQSRAVAVEEIVAASESDALHAGFALKEERVRALNDLAGDLYKDLKSGRRWLPQVKMIGSGVTAEIVDYEEFNAGEFQQFRGLLDDIAKETGERKAKVEHTGKDGGAITIEIEYV